MVDPLDSIPRGSATTITTDESCPNCGGAMIIHTYALQSADQSAEGLPQAMEDDDVWCEDCEHRATLSFDYTEEPVTAYLSEVACDCDYCEEKP